MQEVLRQEKKFLLSLPQTYALGHRLSQVMTEDIHNQNGGYSIRSLYFDTLDNTDYLGKENGIELRRKIRLRCYSPDAAFAQLEMKQKQGPYQKKRSLRIPREDARQLIDGNYSVLLRQQDPFAAECFALLQMHGYRPRSVVEYRRRAFVARENNIRVTLDSCISATESCLDLFSPTLTQAMVTDPALAILEVKYNGFLLSYIKDLLQSCSVSETSASKYGMSRAVSMHATF